MEEKRKSGRFPDDARGRAVRLVRERNATQCLAVGGAVVGGGQDRLHVRDAATVDPEGRDRLGDAPQRDHRHGTSGGETRRDVQKLRQANEIPKNASAFFAQAP